MTASFMHRAARTLALSFLMAVASTGALAHDTWFAPEPAAPDGGAHLRLGTGTRFPLHEFTQTPGSVERMGCVDGEGRAQPLDVVAQRDKWLELSTAPQPSLACWAALHPVDIVLAPEVVPVYLREIHASPQVRQVWADRQARGLPWQESYRKLARYEAGPPTPALRQLQGLPLELVVLGQDPVRARQALSVRLLRDGKPLPDFPLEFISERSPVGIWRTTDAAGETSLVLPFGGRWLVRGVLLWPVDGERWSSDFVTIAVTAAAQ